MPEASMLSTLRLLIRPSRSSGSGCARGFFMGAPGTCRGRGRNPAGVLTECVGDAAVGVTARCPQRLGVRDRATGGRSCRGGSPGCDVRSWRRCAGGDRDARAALPPSDPLLLRGTLIRRPRSAVWAVDCCTAALSSADVRCGFPLPARDPGPASIEPWQMVLRGAPPRGVRRGSAPSANNVSRYANGLAHRDGRTLRLPWSAWRCVSLLAPSKASVRVVLSVRRGLPGVAALSACPRGRLAHAGLRPAKGACRRVCCMGESNTERMTGEQSGTDVAATRRRIASERGVRSAVVRGVVSLLHRGDCRDAGRGDSSPREASARRASRRLC